MQEQVHRPVSHRAGLFERIDSWLHERQRRATEAWLATSQNVAELETRLRDMNRGTVHPFY